MLGKKNQNKTRIHPLVFSALILCVLYWIYLGYISQMIIVYDAVSYQDLGTLIKTQGWGEYLRQGPSREPVYPFLVSLAMRLAEIFSVSFQSTQKIIQFLILLATQLLTLKLLRTLKINTSLTLLTILYLGFSPAILNTALSLYSEIAAYPFILAMVLTGAQAWRCLQTASLAPGKTSRRRIIFLGGLLGLSLLLATLVKAVFELITPFFMLPFTIFFARAVRQKKKNLFLSTLIFFIACSCAYYGPLLSYKYANKKYNGVFALTDRGSWALYGNTVRRIEPLNSERFKTALATIPGEGLCQSLFGDPPCVYWTHRPSDDIGLGKLAELNRQSLSRETINKELQKLSLQHMLRHPFQYLLLMILEGLKMFFWESTNIGFVAYPDGLAGLYDSAALNWGLSFGMALLTAAAVIFAFRYTWRKRREIFGTERDPEEPAIILFCVILVLTPFIGLHSFFLVLKRYVLPLAPLYLALIAFFLQTTSASIKKRLTRAVVFLNQPRHD